MVFDGNGFKVKVPHPVNLQLEGERGLQVTVDSVLHELESVD